MNFSVFDVATGELVRTGTSPEDQFSVQAAPGQAVVASNFERTKHYWRDGAVAAYTAEQAATKAVRPAYAVRWSNFPPCWVFLSPEVMLEMAKWSQWLKIKTMRDARKSGGFKVGLKWFHSDEPSRAQYGILLTTALEKLLLDSYVLNAAWKDMSGVKEPLTVGILRQIRDAGLTLEATLFAVAEAHRASMEAALNPETYDFSTGWPATFGGTP